MIKISVTGTKGKTTVVNVLSSVLQACHKSVLKVDTTGHYVNGIQKSTLDESNHLWSLVPTVSPGRYLWEFKDDVDNPDNVAVLECALGSSGGAGLGYRNHEIGVFLNVFEDHLGSSERLKTKEDIANAKSFVFSKIDKGGAAVFNADDELVCRTLSVIPKDSDITLIPCGLNFDYFNLDAHLQSGRIAITLQGSDVIQKSQRGDEVLFSLSSIPWAFNGSYMPSVWNLLHVAGVLVAYFGPTLPSEVRNVVESVRLDPYGGRLTVLKAANGTTIIADYAHEKISLREVGRLAKHMAGDNGKAIGVVRLAYDRTDELIEETGHFIANDYDRFIVYDKIDGHWRQPKVLKSKTFTQEVGKISEQFVSAIKPHNANVERILREDEAIKRASEVAGPDDVVVIIVNDDIKQSMKFIKDAFQAEFA